MPILGQHLSPADPLVKGCPVEDDPAPKLDKGDLPARHELADVRSRNAGISRGASNVKVPRRVHQSSFPFELPSCSASVRKELGQFILINPNADAWGLRGRDSTRPAGPINRSWMDT